MGVKEETLARHVGRDLPGVCVLSTMAINQHGLNELNSWPTVPGVIEWMPPNPGGGHPSWQNDAFRLRDPATGRVVPRVLKMFGASEPSKIAAFGFSAGANSGLREVLRSKEDREAISFCASIDGIHAVLSYAGVNAMKTGTAAVSDPRAIFKYWDQQVSPLAEYALSAARGERILFVTGNNLAPPETPEPVSSTPFGMKWIYEWLKEQSGVKPYNEKGARAFADLGTPMPAMMFGRGQCYFFVYTGTRREDHIEQANVIIPRILRSVLKPLWIRGGEA